MGNPLILSLLFAAGVALCLLAFAPEYVRSPFRPLFNRAEGPLADFRKLLSAAGMFDEAPTFIIVTALLASVAVGLVIAILVGQPVAFIIGPLLVVGVGYGYLQRRQRQLIKTTADSLIPFMRRIEGAVRVGVPAPAAYREAVAESPPAVQRLLADSVAEMMTGTPFMDALRRTQERLPLRMWSIFVRQMEIHDEAGGDVAKGLSATVRHIDTMVSLQRQGRAHYATFATQQRIAFGLGAVATFFLALQLDPELLHETVTSVIGWIFLFAGFGFIAGGFFLSRNSLKAIQKRIDF